MSKPSLLNLGQSFFGKSRKKSSGRRGQRQGRSLNMERLEARQLMSVTQLQSASFSQDASEKPQSKMFEYAGQWWSVMPDKKGTWVYRLDGTSWTQVQQISTNKKTHADVKVSGDLAYVLMFSGSKSQVATLQYDAIDNRFELWGQQPNLVNVSLSGQTGTIDIDSTGRLWIASVGKTGVEARYSDGLHTSFSGPITVGAKVGSSDMSSIIAMPNGTIGIFWSDQKTKRFGFSTHEDGAAPNAWSANEVPGDSAALNIGHGMADNHMHLAVSSNGTLYAVIKTGYDKKGYPLIGLLVRRPNGAWDDFYNVTDTGTRPVIVLDESSNQLVVAYTTATGGGDIIYRTSSLDTISFSGTKVLIPGKVNNVTTAKMSSNGQVAFLADSKSALFTFDTTGPVVNLPPVVNAGADRTGTVGSPVTLNGTATDDNKPTPGGLSVLWSVITAPGSVAFGNSASASTTATFGAAGTYTLQLTANDGEYSRIDQVTIVVSASPGGGTGPGTDPGAGGSQQIAFQNGLFPSVSYAGTIDTKINGKNKNTTKNYGNDTKLSIDGDPDEAGLFRWDVSAIPVGSQVESVTIELTVTSKSKETYEVYALERAWDELAATWQQYANGSSWSGAGASGSADVDSSVLGAMTPTSKGTYRITLNDAGKAAVQAWINDPSQNYGIIIKDYNNKDPFEVASSEYKTASQRPKLVINYTEPQPVVNSFAVANLPPVVTTGASLVAQAGQPIAITANVSDDGLPGGSALLAALWSQVSGPDAVSFGDDHVVDTTAQFSSPGTYTLRLTVSDGLLSSFADLSVSVS